MQSIIFKNEIPRLAAGFQDFVCDLWVLRQTLTQSAARCQSTSSLTWHMPGAAEIEASSMSTIPMQTEALFLGVSRKDLVEIGTLN